MQAEDSYCFLSDSGMLGPRKQTSKAKLTISTNYVQRAGDYDKELRNVIETDSTNILEARVSSGMHLQQALVPR